MTFRKDAGTIKDTLQGLDKEKLQSIKDELTNGCVFSSCDGGETLLIGITQICKSAM